MYVNLNASVILQYVYFILQKYKASTLYMGIRLGTDRLTSECTECGYFCNGTITDCPQCKQIALLQQQSNHNYSYESSNSRLSESDLKYIFLFIGAILLLGLIAFIFELIRSIFAFISKLFEAVWGAIKSPFYFFSEVTGASISTSIIFIALAAALIFFGLSKNKNNSSKGIQRKPASTKKGVSRKSQREKSTQTSKLSGTKTKKVNPHLSSKNRSLKKLPKQKNKNKDTE